MSGTITNRRIKRILFIQPPAFSWRLNRLDINPNPPMGAAYMAAVLEREGYEVGILDAFVEGWFRDPVPLEDDPENIPFDAVERVGLSFKEIAARIEAFKPDVIGITNLFTCQRKNAHTVCRIVKEIDRDIIVVIGGKNPTALTDVTMQDPNIDFAIRGEGEATMLQLLRAVEQGQDFATIDGVAYRDADGTLRVNPKTQFIDDMDTIPFPARHLLPMELYFDAAIAHGGSLINRRYASVITSRGCPAECFFCSAHGSMGYKFRYRSVENVLAEIDELVKTYQIGEILFEDDNLTMHRERAKRLCNALIERNYNLTWDTPNGLMAITLDNELLLKMKQSGCYRVNLAIESGNQHVVNNVIRKPLDLKKVPPMIDYARSIGLQVGLYLVIGNPGETLDQMRESYLFARKSKVFPHVSVAMPLPGTELLEIAQKNGYLVDGFSWENLTINQYSMHTPDWSVEEMKALKSVEELKLRIFLAPQFIGKVFRSLIERPVGTLTTIAVTLTKSSKRDTYSYLNFRWILKGLLYEIRDWFRRLKTTPQSEEMPDRPRVLRDSALIQFPKWDHKPSKDAPDHVETAMPLVLPEEHAWTLRRSGKAAQRH